MKFRRPSCPREDSVGSFNNSNSDDVLTENATAVAQTKYTLDDMLKPFGIYAREQLSLASHIGDKLGIAIPASETSQEPVPAPMNEPATEIAPVPVPEAIDLNMDGLEDFGLDDLFEKQTSGLVESALASFLAQENEANEAASTPTVNGDNELAQLQAVIDGSGTKTDGAGASQPNGSLMTDYKELEALVAESTSNYVRTTLQGLSPAPYQPVVPVSTGKFFGSFWVYKDGSWLTLAKLRAWLPNRSSTTLHRTSKHTTPITPPFNRLRLRCSKSNQPQRTSRLIRRRRAPICTIKHGKLLSRRPPLIQEEKDLIPRDVPGPRRRRRRSWRVLIWSRALIGARF
jgi:hypothetical protein